MCLHQYQQELQRRPLPTPDAVGGPGRYVEVDSLLIPT